MTYFVEVMLAGNALVLLAGWKWRRTRKSPVSSTVNMSNEFDNLNS